MTWEQLKERIEAMPDDMQNNEVKAFGELGADMEVVVDKCADNMYTNVKWEECVEGWELEEEQMNDPGTIMVAKKGEYVLWVV